MVSGRALVTTGGLHEAPFPLTLSWPRKPGAVEPAVRRNAAQMSRPRRTDPLDAFCLEADATFVLESFNEFACRDSLVTHSSLVTAALFALVASVTAVRAEEHPVVGLVGPDPWAVAAASPAFGPDDAFLFEDADPSGRLSPEALEVAERIDRERLAAGAPETPASGRVGEAFEGFTRYGRDGLSYATLDVARAVDPTRFAEGPEVGPSRVALNLAFGR